MINSLEKHSFETLPFYRGVSAEYAVDCPSIHAPRTNRRPKNSSIHFHTIADRWFAKRFGIHYRSNAVFLTSGVLSATTYAHSPAHVMRILPLGPYRFCWSANVSDLLFSATQFAEAEEAVIEAHMDSKGYCESDLLKAYEIGHEVMLYCEQYIAIPIGLCGVKPKSTSASILLA